jgi:hypothetical protein
MILSDAATALERISRNSENGIPDSVLNAAKSEMTVPSLAE